jgi:carboxyl-terminal processing protease
LTAATSTDIHQSDIGRPLYGGGGITPDHIVTIPKTNDFQDLMARKYAYFGFVTKYLASNPTITTSWQVSDAMLADFKKYIKSRSIEFTDSDFDANRDYLKRMIKFEVYQDRLGVTEANRVLLDADPQVVAALSYMPEAKVLNLNKARRQVAQR